MFKTAKRAVTCLATRIIYISLLHSHTSIAPPGLGTGVLGREKGGVGACSAGACWLTRVSAVLSWSEEGETGGVSEIPVKCSFWNELFAYILSHTLSSILKCLNMA